MILKNDIIEILKYQVRGLKAIPSYALPAESKKNLKERLEIFNFLIDFLEQEKHFLIQFDNYLDDYNQTGLKK